MTTVCYHLSGPEPAYAAADAPAGGPAATGATTDRKGSRPQTPTTPNAREISTNFGAVISLMLRSRHHRLTMLAELEWMLVPAITTRQFRIGEGTSPENGVNVPIAAVLWASVSAEVDQRISRTLDLPLRLKPQEWRSGDIVWIVEAIGDAKAIDVILQHLKQTELKDRLVRMRVSGKDGKTTIGRVEMQHEPAGADTAPGRQST